MSGLPVFGSQGKHERLKTNVNSFTFPRLFLGIAGGKPAEWSMRENRDQARAGPG